MTYGMAPVVGTEEGDLAVQAGEGCAAAVIAVGIEFLLREDIAAALRDESAC